MTTLGNFLWFILCGLWLGLAWILCGLLLCCTIVLIPAGLQCFKIAQLAFLPFGKDIEYSGGSVSLLVNLLWIVLFGWEIALSAALGGIVFSLTIIGLPFGRQCFKIAQLALMPFGANIRDRAGTTVNAT